MLCLDQNALRLSQLDTMFSLTLIQKFLKMLILLSYFVLHETLIMVEWFKLISEIKAVGLLIQCFSLTLLSNLIAE